tara:strand:- start:100 stop:1026 length:927 start_codon:yes stop_codon:yes gene_type:complete
MKINFFIILIYLLVNLFNISFAQLNNDIVIKVENQIVTSFEIKNKIFSILTLTNQEINQENINQVKKQALDNLVKHKLKIIELSKYKFQKDETQMNKYLNAISSNNINSLKEKFKKNNMNFDLLLEEIEIQFKWQKLIYQIYANRIQIDQNSIDQELINFSKDQFNIEEFRLSEIEILASSDDLNKKNILNIQNKIKLEGFDATAVKFSISSTASMKGDIGWINKGSLSKEMLKVLNKLEIGEISNPIKKLDSILFFKLTDKKKSKFSDTDLIALKEKLINQKRNELFKLYSQSHLSKIKNNSLIEYK